MLFAAGLVVAAVLNVLLVAEVAKTAATLAHSSAIAAETGLSDASYTLTAIAELVSSFGQALTYLGFALVASGVAAVVGLRKRKQRQPAAPLKGIPNLLEALVASVTDLEGELASKRAALQETEERRKRNEELISISHRQAEAVRDELRSEGRFQTKLWVIGTVLTLILAVVGFVVAN